MQTMTRRVFLMAAAALPGGCALARRAAAPAGPPAVREPALGQSWTYARHDLYTGAVVDTQIDRIAAVERIVQVDSLIPSDAKDVGPTPSAATSWLHKYFSHPKPGGPLPSEIQEPWGMVRVDPHWSQVQVFDVPIPLWPSRFTPGWHDRFTTRYQTADRPGDGFDWHQTMKAEEWETVHVPAGEFKALRYLNVINFQSSDPARTQAVRRESIWFAPQVGRWVVRESRGSYYLDDSVSDSEYEESSYRWELLAWT